jgi:hypothetical protein
MRRFSFVFSVIIFGVGIGWMGLELLRVGWKLAESQGFAAMLTDGVVWHKIGELMVAAPFAWLAIMSNQWPVDKLQTFFSRTKWIMIAGGVLNGIAWLTLRYRVDWHIWCLILLIWGTVAAPLFGKYIITLAQKIRSENT